MKSSTRFSDGQVSIDHGDVHVQFPDTPAHWAAFWAALVEASASSAEGGDG